MARIESLHEFRLRTEWFSGESIHYNNGEFMTNGELKRKVNEDGSLKTVEIGADGSERPYGGNTVVFLLEGDYVERLVDIQSKLYQFCGNLLAEPLQPSTFHMTLHDLKNRFLTPGLAAQIQKSEAAVKPLLREIKGSGVVRIRMKATYLFNMNNSSVVLGLAPADEDNCYRLMRLYELFQNIESIRLPYQLTPHITMAYYKPGTYKEQELAGLRRAINEVNREVRQLKPLEIELNTEQLVYQTFTDMNHYVTAE